MGDEEELGGMEGRETIIWIHYMGKMFPIKGKNKIKITPADSCPVSKK